MWWYCGYRALPGVRASQLERQFLRQHDAGSNRQENLRGWFTFPTGTAGFVLMEADTPRDVAAVIAPYARLAQWHVEAVSELNYNQVLEELRSSRRRSALDDLMAGTAPSALVDRVRG
jgi:hypothetical protein